MDKYGYTNVYRVTTYDHTAFDSYNGQDVIAFEEFRSSFKIEDMLKYLEGYPLMLPSRYNNKVACYTKVYIITNLGLHEQYKNVQAQYSTTWATFLRRIETVYNFDKSKEIPVNKLAGELLTKQMKLCDLTLSRTTAICRFNLCCWITDCSTLYSLYVIIKLSINIRIS